MCKEGMQRESALQNYIEWQAAQEDKMRDSFMAKKERWKLGTTGFVWCRGAHNNMHCDNATRKFTH